MLEHFIITGICITIFILGIVVQKYCFDSTAQASNFQGFMRKQDNLSKSIVDLDETKVVFKIDTSSLEKKTDLVSNTTTSKNDTINAIDKLKNMKGK